MQREDFMNENIVSASITPNYIILDDIQIYCPRYRKYYVLKPQDDLTAIEAVNISALLVMAKHITDMTASIKNKGLERHFEVR